MTSTMQLEFAQAMTDFKIMFPGMDKEVIEAVLRANQGAVDSTIDQLLAMSTDNQNEVLRNELDKPGNISSLSTSTENQSQEIRNTSLTSTVATPKNTGTAPKIKSTVQNFEIPSPKLVEGIPLSVQKKWAPPMLGALPVGFLRLPDSRIEFDISDEQFAIMLQNEEFVNELRWNQEFMLSLDKEQQEKGRVEEDAVFKERLKHMGKKSRKKFLQLARVFTWQRNKKPCSVKQLNSLLLEEDHSDEDEPKKIKK